MRNNFHTSTLPSKVSEQLIENHFVSKNFNDVKELIGKLIISGKVGPNLFDILISSSAKLMLRIPDTLYKIENSVYYLYSDNQNLVNVLSGEGCIKSFISNTKKQKNNENTPKYLFFDTKFRICMNSKQAREFWHVSKSEVKILQRFICGSKQNNHKLRVYWKINSGIRYIMISGQLPTLIKNVKMQSFKNSGTYIHKVSDYNFAGKILKSSFNPSLPNKSSILSKSEKSLLPKTIEENEAAITKKFLIRFSDQNKDVCEVPSIKNIEKSVENIINFLNLSIQQPSTDELVQHHQKLFKQNTLSELIVDYILDESENWCFLKCKRYKTSLKAQQHTEFFSSKTLQNNPSSYNSEMFELSSLNARLKSLGNRSKEFLIKQNKFLTPKTIESSNKDFYSSHYLEINLCTNRSLSPLYAEHTELYSKEINKVAAHYDEIRFQAKKNKIETMKRMSLVDNRQKIQIIIMNSIEKIKEFPELINSIDNCKSFFSAFLGKVLEGEKILEFFVKFQAIYEWNVSLKQFKIISNIFLGEVKNSNIFVSTDIWMLNKFLQKYEGITFKSGLNL